MAELGANVSLVPESVAHRETLEDDIITCDYNLPPAYREAEVPVLGDAYPDDTAPWGYIVTHTGSATSRKSPDQGAYITGVEYRQVKTPFASGIDGLREAYRKFRTGRRGRRMGTRIFYAADADAEALVEDSLPEGLPMAEGGQWVGALLRETILEQRWRVGLAKITAIYDTYAEHGDLEPTGRGILEADAAAVRMWNNFKVEVGEDETREEHVVNVPFKDDESETRRRWAVIEGANAWPYVRAQLRIKALLTESQLNALAPLVGKVNDDTCLAILNAPKHTLWFNQLTMRQRQRSEGRRYDTIVYLMLDPLGWDAKTIAELQEYRVEETPVFEADGETDTERKQRIGVWVPVANTPTKKLLGWVEDDFDIINGYLA